MGGGEEHSVMNSKWTVNNEAKTSSQPFSILSWMKAPFLSGKGLVLLLAFFLVLT